MAIRRCRPVVEHLFIVIIITVVKTSFTAAAAFQLGMSASSMMSETSERLSRWQSRWESNDLGWHTNDVHHAIQNHGNKMIPNFIAGAPKDTSILKEGEVVENANKDDVCTTTTDSAAVRVFFPLCGKTVDMAFMAKHNSVSTVVGVDGIQKALDEFVLEHPELEINKMETTTKEDADGTEQSNDDTNNNNKLSQRTHDRFIGNKIMLLKGDFFALDESVTDGRFDVIIDRASFVAIDPSLREQYVKTISGLIKRPNGKILLVVIERNTGTDEEKKRGPPFSVSEEQVRTLYETKDWVESVILLDDNGEPDRGDVPFRTLYFLIQTK